MASIVKRKNKWAVIYNCEDDKGVKRQHWETFATNADAKKRKSQIEFQQSTGTFIAPSAKTVKDLMDEYVAIYGVNTWAMSTYDSNRGTIDNYILPLIGDVKLDDITTHMMDKFYQSLLTVKPKPRPYQKTTNACMSARGIKEIHKLLRSAFNQAVKWELISHNPVVNCTLPKSTEKERQIWSAETLFEALEKCNNDILSLALNLAFSCSLRMGEMLGLTWDCIDITEESINANRAYIFVNKELQRVSRRALEALSEKDVMHIFPAVMGKNTTALVLKTPKTKTSVRKVFLPKAVAEMLIERRKQIDEYKDYFGDEYTDYNLVFCNTMGRPIEGGEINTLLHKLIQENNLPKVVFHSIRHTSTTYKLKLSGGDIKAVQGDTGHAQATMVTERYAHILDDDRRVNAERFQEAFYAHNGPVDSEAQVQQATGLLTDEKMELLKLLEQSPELVAVLKAMVSKK